jgi:hypothetical protein
VAKGWECGAFELLFGIKGIILREGGNNAVYAITIELNNKIIML